MISLESYAKEIGITGKNFLSDLIYGKYSWYVQDDLKEDICLGVKEILAFFINGNMLNEPISFANLKAEIEAAVRQSQMNFFTS